MTSYTKANKRSIKKKRPAARLKRYRQRRNFALTPEPEGSVKRNKHRLRFVIQHHHASHDHYDLRLEIDGVLKSWAVPKGPSYNPSVKRLAIETEDHPLEYARFEGTIAKGQYGGGTVMVWDLGTYTNLKKQYGLSMSQSYDQGKLEFFLRGKKMKGAFALLRMQSTDASDQWLLFKLHDAYASKKKNPVSTQKKSALTNRTMYQIAQQER